MRRLFAGVSLVALAMVTLRAQDATQFRDTHSEDFFHYARMAVGGGTAAAIKTLSFKGKSKIPGANGASTITADVEIKMLLPDYYIRIDSTRSSQRITGFGGKTLLSEIREGDSRSFPPDQLKPQLLKAERFRMARLLLATTTYVSSEMSIRFQSIGGAVEMVAPRTSAGNHSNSNAATVDLSHLDPLAIMALAEDGFATRWVVDNGHIPVQLIYQGGTNGATVTMTFADRRQTDGMLMPYRITTTNGDRLVDELSFTQVLINPEIGKGDFKR
jgi:hypothetical protein